MTLSNSTISSNSTVGDHAFGGGIYALGDLTLSNSTVSGNSTLGDHAFGGGIYAFGAVTLTNSTISGNRTAGVDSHGGGISAGKPIPITILNSIVAGNTAPLAVGQDLFINDPGSTLTINYSLIGDTSGSSIDSETGTGNLLNVDPMLGPLADNGGFTETRALLAGSPAIDAGDPSIPFDENEFDQRGQAPFYRVANGRIDMGAYELQPTADFDQDNDVDGFDFLAWQRGYGTPAPHATQADGDADNDLDVDGDDLAVWQSQYGNIYDGAMSAVSVDLAAESPRSNSALVDLALAVPYSQRPRPEEETGVADQPASAEVAGSNSRTRDNFAATARSRFADVDDLLARLRDVDESQDRWLTYELLERVFG